MALVDQLLEIVPDEPGWVDSRGVLLDGPVLFGSVDGWVAVRSDRRILVAGGLPSQATIAAARAAAEPEFDALATGGAITAMETALGMRARRAVIHAIAPTGLREFANLPAAELLAADAPLDHLSSAFRRELAGVIGQRPVSAVIEDGVPVSFCYPTLVTERHWDVTIVTLEGYRRAGRAVAAFHRVERAMRTTGRAPVWGAAEDNPASLALAKKLGFVPVAEVAIFELVDWNA